MTNEGKDILLAQGIFGGVYLVALGVVMACYRMAKVCFFCWDVARGGGSFFMLGFGWGEERRRERRLMGVWIEIVMRDWTGLIDCCRYHHTFSLC